MDSYFALLLSISFLLSLFVKSIFTWFRVQQCQKTSLLSSVYEWCCVRPGALGVKYEDNWLYHNSGCSMCQTVTHSVCQLPNFGFPHEWAYLFVQFLHEQVNCQTSSGCFASQPDGSTLLSSRWPSHVCCFSLLTSTHKKYTKDWIIA